MSHLTYRVITPYKPSMGLTGRIVQAITSDSAQGLALWAITGATLAVCAYKFFAI